MASEATPMAASPASACSPMPTPGGVSQTIPAGAQVQFKFFYCTSPGHLIVQLGKVGDPTASSTVLIDQNVPPPPFVDLHLPLLPAGTYALTWTYAPAATDSWQSVSELHVAEVLRFRRFHSNATSSPLVLGFLFLEVV